MDNRTIAAIIQARMGSSRLPGKVLLPLAGKPLLWHIIHRLRKCRTLDVIAVATSDRPEDDTLTAWCEEEGVPVVRGSENNVLQRYALAADVLKADYIVRVTGDAPLVDPGLLDCMIERLRTTGADYCIGEPGVACIHEGFAPLTRAALERIVEEAGADPIAREHVDTYIKHHPDDFRICTVPIPEAHRIEGTRVSVDTPSDLVFLDTLYNELNAEPGELEVAAAVALLRHRPELMAINAHVRQKTATAGSYRLVVRCDGTPKIGLGHVVRCLAVAQRLRDTHGVGVSFALSAEEPGPAMVHEAAFPFDLWDGQTHEGAWLQTVLTERRADALLLDIRTDLAVEQLAAWRREGLLVAVLDDPSDRRLAAELAFYPPVPQLQEMDWNGFDGQLCSGWEWLPLRPGFNRKVPEPNNPIPRVAVTMGASDPAGLSLRALQALEAIDRQLQVRLILGRAFAHRPALEKLLPDLRQPMEIINDVADMPAALADIDLAVASFGVTAWELASLGVPAVLLGLSPDHARSAEALHKAGMARSLGEHTAVSDTALTAAIADLLANPTTRQAVRAASKVADGLGAERIAARLVERLTGRSAQTSSPARESER